MYLPQLRPRLNAQLIGQDLVCVPVGSERLRSAAVAGQCEHEQDVQPFPQRFIGYELSQLADNVGVPSEVKVRLDRCLSQLYPQLGQPRELIAPQYFRVNVGQWLAAPKRQRRTG